MLLQKPLFRSCNFSGKKLDSQNNKAENKNEQADTVNTMHIADPFIFWPVGVFLTQV